VVCRRDVIKAIRQGLSVLLLGMLIASVSAHERIDGFGHPPVAGYIRGFGYHDWLAPGGLVFSPVPALEHPPLYPAPIVEPPYYPEPAERGCCNPCDDCNPCTEDTCTPDGCVNAPINCDDGNPCTVDTCGPDGCMNIPVDCDDGNPCTIDSCGPNGCIHSPVAPPVDPLPESKCCEKSKPHIVKEVRPSVQAWRGAYWYNDIAMPKWPQLTETCVEVKSNEEIVYPWTGRHLGVDAWYGAFWYTKVFTPKWPQF